MKKIIFLMMLAAAQTVGAQQLPNVGFESWKGSGNAGYTYQSSSASVSGTSNEGLRQRPGDEPIGWMGSSINQKVIMQKKQELIFKKGSSSNYYAELKNTFVGVGSIGSNAPAFLTFGTPWVYAVTTIDNCDGGTYGGVNFTCKPDYIRGKVKKTATSTAESSYIIAYIWNGTFTSQIASSSTNDVDRLKNDVDRAILGSVSGTGVTSPSRVTSSGNLIAWCNHAFKNTTDSDSDWETITVPLNYVAANLSEIPSKMNVVICAGDYWTRGNIQNGTILDVDDVEFVYNSQLQSLMVDGVSVSNFDKDTYDYSIDEYYVQGTTQITWQDNTFAGVAIVNGSYDYSTCKYSITVKGQDYDVNSMNTHTYTIQFKAPEPGPEVVSSKTYPEGLYVSFARMTSDKQVADVLVQTLDNDNINFVLKNFVLFIGEDILPVGNIAVTDIEVATDGSFAFKGSTVLADGDDTTYEGMWGASDINDMCGGAVPLDMRGKFIDDDHVVVYIEIDLTDVMGYTVDVYLGYAHAAMAVDAEAKYGTFCAPFAVAVPDGVQASTVTSAAANGQLTLAEVSGTIPANTPVVLFAESGLEATDFFDIAVSGTPTAGLLTGVYENTPAPVGSYVLQNNDKVGFFQVVAGQQPTVGANRCYLIAPLGSYTVTAKAFYFEDDATGISTVDNGQWTMDNAIYNLAGQRISKMQKGVNINNGKKILR